MFGLKKFSTVAGSGAALIAVVAAVINNLGTIEGFVSSKLEESENDITVMVHPVTEYSNSGMYEFENSDEESTLYKVDYIHETAAENIQIFHSSSYGQGAAKEIGNMGEGPFFWLPKFGLDIKITNNSPKAIFITDAVLDVEESQPDNQPLMLLTTNYINLAEISFTNDGWAEPSKVELRANLQGGEKIDLASQLLPYRKVVETLMDDTTAQTHYRFDIKPLLAKMNFPVNDIAKYDNAPRDTYENSMLAIELGHKLTNACSDLNVQLEQGGAATHEEIENVPQEDNPDEDEYASIESAGCGLTVEGELNIAWTSASGEEREQQFAFETIVTIVPPEGLGAGGFSPTGEYDLQLRTNEKNYQLRKNLSQPIEAGKFDRFILWLGAEYSSHHNLAVNFTYNNDGQLSAKKIELNYLMPKYNRAYLNWQSKQQPR